MWKHLNNTRLVRYLLLFILAWILMRVIVYFEAVLVIFVFAAIVAFLLNYPVNWVSRSMPRSFAVILVFLLALIILGILGATHRISYCFSGTATARTGSEPYQ